jgi:ABC-type nitrate/sulfonate/bicarbonate transport system substrate-binding protein
MSHRPTTLLRTSALLAALGLLGACSGGASPAASSPAPTTSSAASPSASGPAPSASRSWEGQLKVTVVEDWNFGYPPWQIWLYPESQGWYADVGLDVEFVIPPTPADPPKFIATNQAQIGFTYTPDTLTAKESGLNLLAVSSLIPVPSEHLICRDDVGITDPKDLEGKKIASYQVPLPDAQFKIFANAQGIDTSKVTTVSAGDNGYPVMMAKQSDCTQAGVFEPSFYKADTGREPVTFYYTDWGLPNWYWEIIAVNPDFAAEHPDAVAAFVEVTLRGYAYARDNVQPTLDYLYTVFPEAKPPGDIEYNADAMTKMFARQDKDYVTDHPHGCMDPTIWQRFSDLMAANGVLKAAIDVGPIVSNDFQPQDCGF